MLTLKNTRETSFWFPPRRPKSTASGEPRLATRDQIPDALKGSKGKATVSKPMKKNMRDDKN